METNIKRVSKLPKCFADLKPSPKRVIMEKFEIKK
jgi:hypothetical protein